jgi:hypothetical protein
MSNDEGPMTTTDYSPRPSWAVASGERAPRRISAGQWDRKDWQRVWLGTQGRDWRTLALVPGDDRIPTLSVANLIARLALDRGESIHVADLRRLRLKHVDAFLEAIRWDSDQGKRIIFATTSASANLSTVPLARAADCAILCVALGATSLRSVREVIDQIGRTHFLGSLLFRQQDRP